MRVNNALIKAAKPERVWAYFNNDREGYALKNAQAFKRLLLDHRPSSAAPTRFAIGHSMACLSAIPGRRGRAREVQPGCCRSLDW
jgi:hypothetical protein